MLRATLTVMLVFIAVDWAHAAPALAQLPMGVLR
jgi:hypothetical protein